MLFILLPEEQFGLKSFVFSGPEGLYSCSTTGLRQTRLARERLCPRSILWITWAAFTDDHVLGH